MSAINVQDIAITSLETITAFGIGDRSGEYLFTLDELQNVSIANGQEKVDITGRGGRKLTSLKRNKTVTISGANGMVSGGLFEMQTGGKFANATTEVMWRDYLTVKTGLTCNTKYVAIGSVDPVSGEPANDNIEHLYVLNDDGTINKKLEQDDTVATGKFTYSTETKALTFSENDVSVGTEILVLYTRKILANTLVNDSTDYSGKCEMYIDAIGEDKCANLYHIQFFIPKADFNGEFTFEMGDNQSVHNFEAEALSGACGSGGKLWTYTIFGAEAPDVA